MGNQDDRLGSLLVFNDIALILSTYGVLLLFNYFVEPINSNTWIVCTFFVGIKILIVGIADITGIGKSYIVSLLFVLVADGIIILINQLMAFGLSLRLMLAMVIADLIIVLIAIFIWKRLGKDRVDLYEGDDWIYGEEEKQAPTPKPAVQAAAPTQTAPVEEKVPEINQPEEKVFFDFKPLENEIPQQSEKPLFDNFDSEPLTAGDDIISFDEITQELPSEDEIQKALNQAQENEVISTSLNYFDGLDIFENETVEPEEEISEPEIVEEPVIELPEVQEEEVVEIPEVEEPEEVQTPVEAVEEPVEEELTETEEKEVEAPPLTEVLAIEEEQEEPVQISVEETEEVKEEIKPEIKPEDIFEPYIFKIPEEEEEEEVLPLFVQTANDYNRITNSTIGFNRRFSIIPVNVDQEQIDTLKDEVKDEMKKLNRNLGALATEYNNSLVGDNTVDQIEGIITLGEDFSVDEGEKVIRENLNKLTEKEFISDQVVNTLLELISKLDNRIYNLNFAEGNLKERLLRDQQLELERQRRQEEAQRKQEEERQKRAQRLKEEEETQAKAEQKEKPSINTNEVLLQNGDMDIIIDAADLELLKEFLQQQDNN